MKRCQQLNSRKKSRKNKAKNRAKRSPVYRVEEAGFNGTILPPPIVILLFPEEVELERDDQVRIAVNQILRPFCQPFDPVTWQREKKGAIVVLPRLFGELACIDLATVPHLGFMIIDGQSIRTVNFKEPIAA